MVADDLGAGAQSEDPFPRRTNDASFSAGHSAADFQSPAIRAAGSLRADGPRPLPAAAGDEAPPGRIALWNRLPRSMWLMSALPLAATALSAAG